MTCFPSLTRLNNERWFSLSDPYRGCATLTLEQLADDLEADMIRMKEELKVHRDNLKTNLTPRVRADVEKQEQKLSVLADDTEQELIDVRCSLTKRREPQALELAQAEPEAIEPAQSGSKAFNESFASFNLASDGASGSNSSSIPAISYEGLPVVYPSFSSREPEVDFAFHDSTTRHHEPTLEDAVDDSLGVRVSFAHGIIQLLLMYLILSAAGGHVRCSNE